MKSQQRRLFGEFTDVPTFRSRLLPVLGWIALSFGVAFVLDQATDQRWSSVWGSAAIVVSGLVVMPGLRTPMKDFGLFALVWLLFNAVRAVADTAGLAVVERDSVGRIEASVFGGTLPSGSLQDRFFRTGELHWYDLLLAVVYGSFFITPFLVAIVFWWKDRARFRRYLVATAFMFAFGLVWFLLLPTSPPWMTHPDDVVRITRTIQVDGLHVVSRDMRGDSTSSREFGFEPNSFAAFPSVHVSVVVLVMFALRDYRRRLAWIVVPYALLMSLAVVYLGEHFLVDAVAGWLLALGAWRLARRAIGFRTDQSHRVDRA